VVPTAFGFPLLARFDRSLQRRKTSGVEGEAEIEFAWSTRLVANEFLRAAAAPAFKSRIAC
jgi:hypothetical protein